jgi:hypothetical protein
MGWSLQMLLGRNGGGFLTATRVGVKSTCPSAPLPAKHHIDLSSASSAFVLYHPDRLSFARMAVRLQALLVAGMPFRHASD